jgi:hypothetical protein
MKLTCNPLHPSHRAIYQERPILHPLQLRQQDYACHPIEVYKVQVQPVAGKGGREKGQPGGRARRVREARYFPPDIIGES